MNLNENPTLSLFVSKVYIKSEIKQELIVLSIVVTASKIRAYQTCSLKAAIIPGVFRLA